MESVRVTFKELMLTSSSSLPFKLYLIAKLETQARQTEEASPCRELSLFLLFVAGTPMYIIVGSFLLLHFDLWPIPSFFRSLI